MKKKTDFALLTNFLVSPWRGYLQLHNELLLIQIGPQGPPEMIFQSLSQIWCCAFFVRSVFFNSACRPLEIVKNWDYMARMMDAMMERWIKGKMMDEWMDCKMISRIAFTANIILPWHLAWIFWFQDEC